MGEDNVQDPMKVAEDLLELLSRNSRPLPAAQLAANLGLPMPLLLKHLSQLLGSGEVVALRTASRVGYGLRLASDAPPASAPTSTESGRRVARTEPAGLDNTRKRLF